MLGYSRDQRHGRVVSAGSRFCHAISGCSEVALFGISPNSATLLGDTLAPPTASRGCETHIWASKFAAPALRRSSLSSRQLTPMRPSLAQIVTNPPAHLANLL